MRAALAIIAGLSALAAVPAPASAADGCGRGFYYNGYRCAPMGGGYDEQRRYGPPPGYYGEPGHPPGRPDCYNVGGRRICCPHRWTVQDGVCKPYRGRLTQVPAQKRKRPPTEAAYSCRP